MTSDASPPGPRIAAVGLASWDRFVVVDRYPAAGEYAVVGQEASLPGGTTSNSAVAMARLGARVAFAGVVGEDEAGVALRGVLAGEGVDVTWLAVRRGERTDGATVVVSAEPPERTIYWHRGAHLVRGDRLDLAAIFAHEVVLLDVADPALRRWLTDLPAHTDPRTRLLGTLTYVVDDPAPDAFAVALRHDVLVGNERELRVLTGVADGEGAAAATRAALRGANCRAVVVSHGAAGCRVLTPEGRWDVPGFAVAAVDTTGAGDAFAAGVAYGLARRWAWPATARFANAVGALATRALGSQASLPTMAEVDALLRAGAP